MKYERNLSGINLADSKRRTINMVMNKITKEKHRFIFPWKVTSIILTSAIAVVMSFFLFFNDTSVNPTALNQYDSDRLMEATYLSGNIIANSIVESTPLALVGFKPLSENETEFEANIDMMNQYFDMLKVFIDEPNIDNLLEVTELTEGDYKYQLAYNFDNINYKFLININGNDIDGLLILKNLELQVEGTLEDSDNEYSLSLTASNGEDYISIDYKTQSKEDAEVKYEIEQSIAGNHLEQEIKVERSDSKVSVEVKSADDVYTLEQYSSNGTTIYYLNYEVNDVEGEVFITETVDSLGNTVYSYFINENGVEKNIDLEDPDDEEEKEEKQREEDEEDEVDEEDEEQTTEDSDDEEDDEDTETTENAYLSEHSKSFLI